METVTVSPEFQVVIPKAVRDALQLSAGQKMQVVAFGDRIELIPVRHMDEVLEHALRWPSGRGLQPLGDAPVAEH